MEALSYWKLMFFSLDQLWNSDIPIHFHGVKVMSYWISNPVKEEVSGGSIRRKYPEEVSGGSIRCKHLVPVVCIRRKYLVEVSGGSIQRKYPEDVHRSMEQFWPCKWNLPGQMKNQFLQKWKKSIRGQPMKKFSRQSHVWLRLLILFVSKTKFQ